MLKDYYKILGVSERAPEQEIRARWIELMKHYHPDVQKGIEFDEISKEINEAYEVLKDPFSRTDYDHDLAQNRYYRRKRVGHRLGFFLLGSILFIAIIYMVIAPKRTSIHSVSQTIRRSVAQPQIEKEASNVIVEAPRPQRPSELDKQVSPIDSVNSSNQPKVKTEDKVKVENNQTNPISPIDQRNQIKEVKVEAKVQVENNQANLRNQTNKTDPRNPSNPINPITQAKAEAKVKENPTNPIDPINPSNQAKVEDKVKVQKDRPDSINPIDPSNSINPSKPTNPITQAKAEAKVQKNPINPRDSIKSSNQPKVKVEAKVQVKQSQPNQINKTDQRNQINSLMAKNEEIKRFFANYVDRYNRRDINGFMSFFSSRAIQNQKDGLEGIKKIYSNFFNQSLQIRYRMSDLKIEIYQNGVNVNAQYELEQLARNGRRNAFTGHIRWVLAREGGGLKIVSLDYQQTKGESHEI